MTIPTAAEIFARLRALGLDRKEEVLGTINKTLRATAETAPKPGEVSAAAIARRIYLYSMIKSETESRKSQKAKAGGKTDPDPAYVVSPKVLEWHEEFEKFCERMLRDRTLPETFEISSDQTSQNFAFLKVRSPRHRFLMSAFSLYIIDFEEATSLDVVNDPRVPRDEVQLADAIRLLFARYLDEDAIAAKEAAPFNVRPARPEHDLRAVPFWFVQDEACVARWTRLFQRYQTRAEHGGDDCAHFALFRERKSKPDTLMKSFLAIRPAQSNPNGTSYYHPSFHIYQAPNSRTQRATPGKVLPTREGVFILGGQYEEPLAKRVDNTLQPPVPFRSLELIYFPWTTFDNEPLINGLMMTINNTKDMMVCRVSARPTLIQHSDDARLGGIAVAQLASHLASIKLKEEEIAAGLSSDTDEHFLDVFQTYPDLLNGTDDGIAGLAQRIELATHNHNGSLELGVFRAGPLGADPSLA